MPFIPVAQTVLAVIEGVMDNQLTINTLHFQNSGAVSIAGMNSLATSLTAWVNGSLAPLLSDDWSSTRVVLTDLDTLTGPRIERAIVAAGGVAGEANPNNVAACVSLRTDQRGRSARGRNYVPGIPGSVVTLNTLDSAFIGDLVAAYSELVGAGTFLAGWQLVIVSYITEGSPRAAGLAIPVTSVTMVGSVVRSMRSREVGHGA